MPACRSRTAEFPVFRHDRRTRRASRLIATLGLALLASIASQALLPGAAWADFAAGLRAFESGDVPTAAREWSAAAEAGDAKAQFRMGQLYETGRGVPQSFVRAHLWYNLAAAQGNDEALKARDAMAARMTPEQVARAQELATTWTPKAAGAVTAPSPSAPSPAVDVAAAVQKASTAEVKRLLAAGGDANAKNAAGVPALLLAVKRGDEAVTAALLESGADPNAADADGAPALAVALAAKQGEIAKTLLKWGANPGAALPDGKTALAIAQETGQSEVADLLRQQAAAGPTESANAAPTAAPAATASAASPDLGRAALAGDAQAIKAALAAGAKPDAPNQDGWTPLASAVLAGNLEAVQALVEGGADVNAPTADGYMPLMMAALENKVDIARYLLEKGADPDRKTPYGVTAAGIAETRGHPEIMALLHRASSPAAVTKAENQPAAPAAEPVSGSAAEETVAAVAGPAEPAAEPAPAEPGVEPASPAKPPEPDAVASAEPPSPTDEQPAPADSSAAPATTNPEPAPTTAEPAAATAEPAGATPEPVAVTPEPVEAEPAPAIKKPAPVVTAMTATFYTVRAANLRADPSKSATKVATLPAGSELKVTGKVSGGAWYRVALPGGVPAYIVASLVTQKPPAAETPAKPAPAAAAVAQPAPATTKPEAGPAVAKLTATLYTQRTAILRAQPSTKAAKVTTLPPGAELMVTGKLPDGRWYQVALPGGKAAFVAASLVDSGPPAAAAPVKPVTSEALDAPLGAPSLLGEWLESVTIHRGPPGRVYRLSLSIDQQSSADDYSGRLVVGVREPASSTGFTVMEDCHIRLGESSGQITCSNAKGAPADWQPDHFEILSVNDRQLTSRWLNADGTVFSVANFQRKG